MIIMRGYPLEGLFQHPSVFGHNQGDSIPAVPHLVVGQDRLVPPDYALPVGAPEVSMGKYGEDARHAHCILCLDLSYASVGDACPFDPCPDKAITVKVCGIFLPAQDLQRSVCPGKGLADDRDIFFLAHDPPVQGTRPRLPAGGSLTGIP